MQHTAGVRLRVEPFTPSGPLAHVAPPVVVSVDPSAAASGGLTDEFVNLVVEELETAAEGGGTLGFPLPLVSFPNCFL